MLEVALKCCMGLTNCHDDDEQERIIYTSSRIENGVRREAAPEVTTDYMYVDNAAMRMIQKSRSSST